MKQIVAVNSVSLAATLATAGGARSDVRPSLPDGDGPPFSGAVRVGDTLYLSGCKLRDMMAPWLGEAPFSLWSW